MTLTKTERGLLQEAREKAREMDVLLLRILYLLRRIRSEDGERFSATPLSPQLMTARSAVKELEHALEDLHTNWGDQELCVVCRETKQEHYSPQHGCGISGFHAENAKVVS